MFILITEEPLEPSVKGSDICGIAIDHTRERILFVLPGEVKIVGYDMEEKGTFCRNNEPNFQEICIDAVNDAVFVISPMKVKIFDMSGQLKDEFVGDFQTCLYTGVDRFGNLLIDEMMLRMTKCFCINVLFKKLLYHYRYKSKYVF